MKWNERFKEWLLDMMVMLDMAPAAFFPACGCTVIGLLLMIIPGFFQPDPVQFSAGTLHFHIIPAQVFHILWGAIALIGVMIMFSGINLTRSRLKKLRNRLY